MATLWKIGRSSAVLLIGFLLLAAAGDSIQESREKARVAEFGMHRPGLGGILIVGLPSNSLWRHHSHQGTPRDLIHIRSHSYIGDIRDTLISDLQAISVQNVLVSLYLNMYVGRSFLSDQVDNLSCEDPLIVSSAQLEKFLCWRSPNASLDGLTNNLCEWRRLDDPLDLVERFLGRARACTSLGHLKEAWSDLILASHLAEKSGESIQTEKLRLLYSESIQKVYDEMIAFQWEQQHDGEAALGITERARAFPHPAPAREGSWRAPEDGVAVSYAVLADRLLIWVVSEGGVSTFERRVPARQVEAKVSHLLRQIRRSEPEIRNLSGELYDLLIPPEITEIAGNKILYFVPDRALNRVPFAALWNPRTGRFLVQDHPVALARSVTRLGERWPEPQPHPSVLLVGNHTFDRKSFPDCANLDGAQAETSAVSSMFPRLMLMTGDWPTSERVLSELDHVDTFIFIGHSVTNSGLPSRSCLLVAPSPDCQDTGVLAGEELAGRTFRHLRLVVLSGCSTVGPTTMRSRSLAGMAGRFLDAGAHAVVGTLWSLNDATALSILTPFYRELAIGSPVVLALQDSQIAALEKGKKVADWADFVAVFN